MRDALAALLELPDVPCYNIKAVVRETRVNVSTLRAWEQRYGLPQPHRSTHGRRLYSERDVGIVRWLREQTEAGLAVSQATSLLHSRIKDEHHVPAAPALPQTSWPTLRQQFLDALGAINVRQAHLMVNNLSALFALETMIVEFFQPVLETMGNRWASGHATVADEHLVTNFVRQRLLEQMQLHAPFSNGPRIIAACVPGEMHELGLLMFSLLMEQQGFEVIYLGQNLPTIGLEDFLRRARPGLLCLSVSLVEHVPALQELAQMVAEHIPGITVAYSGRIFADVPDLAARLPGHYLGTELASAVARAVELGGAAGLMHHPGAGRLPHHLGNPHPRS